jgi:transcriptional regulator with XRE-family HTH domain
MTRQEAMLIHPSVMEPAREAERMFALGMQQLRKDRGLSQAALAEILERNFHTKLDASAITRMEKHAAPKSSGARAIRLGEAFVIAVSLGASLDEMLGFERSQLGPLDEQLDALEEQRNRIVTRWREAMTELAELDERIRKIREAQHRESQPKSEIEQRPASEIGTAELINQWPEILRKVKRQRRHAWILLKELSPEINKVHSCTLTLAFWDRNAADEFLAAEADGNVEVALDELFGGDWVVEAAVKPDPWSSVVTKYPEEPPF